MVCQRIIGQNPECQEKSPSGDMCSLCCRHIEALNRRLTAQHARVDVQHGAAFVDRELMRMAVKEAEQQRELLYAQAQARATVNYNPKCISQGCLNPCTKHCNCTDCTDCNK